MSSRKTDPMPGTSRFQSKVRHYHQSNKTEEVTWDDWIGDKVKSPARHKFDKIIVGIGTVVVGFVLLSGVVGVIYFVLKKILPMVGK